MKKVFLSLLISLLLVSVVCAQQTPVRLTAPQYVGFFKYYDYIIPTYISGGYNLYFTKNTLNFSRSNSEVNLIEAFNLSSSSTLSEFYLQGNVGRVAARYYYTLPKSFSGSGILSRDQYEFTTMPTSLATTKTNVATSFDGKIGFSKFELGVPLFIDRLGATLEPFFVAEWIPRSFSLSPTSTETSIIQNLETFNRALNSGDSSIIGVGLLYHQMISTSNDLSMKLYKTYAQKSNNILFDVKTNLYIGPTQDSRIPVSFLGLGYTYRSYSFSSELGNLSSTFRGPYLEIGLQF